MNFKFRNYYLDEGKFVTSYPIAGGAEIRLGLPARKVVYIDGDDFGLAKEKRGFFSQESPFDNGMLRSYGFDVVKE